MSKNLPSVCADNPWVQSPDRPNKWQFYFPTLDQRALGVLPFGKMAGKETWTSKRRTMLLLLLGKKCRILSTITSDVFAPAAGVLCNDVEKILANSGRSFVDGKEAERDVSVAVYFCSTTNMFNDMNINIMYYILIDKNCKK